MILERKKEIRMWCNQAGAPVYLENVDWSDLNLRERQPNEIVHYRQDQHEACLVCGQYNGVWVENESTHFMHKDKCR